MTQKENPCGDCTYCCEVLSFVSRSVPPSIAREFYRARGCKLHHTKQATFITIEYPCPHLEKGKGCGIEGSKPESCRNFDGRNNPVTREKCRLK